MNDTTDTLRHLVDNPDAVPDRHWTDEMARKWPYFTVPAMLELQRAMPIDEERRRQLMNRVALNAPSAEALYRLVSPDSAAGGSNFYPDETPHTTPSTDQAIDTFIDNYSQAGPEETSLIERLIFNPVPDYALLLADEEERSLPDATAAADNSQDGLINAFILKSREQYGGHFPPVADEKPEAATTETATSAPQPEKAPLQSPEAQDDSLLSESLAKIYIKQRRYAKAHEIITRLSLNYPEKSIYFADQLRFLQKLIINEQYNNRKTT